MSLVRDFRHCSLLLVFVLASSTSAQIVSPYVTSGVSYNPTAAASSVPQQTSKVYQLPLVPLDASLSSWGANVSRGSGNGDSQYLGVYPLSINNHTSFPAADIPNTADITVFDGAKLQAPESVYNYAYPLLPNDGNVLNLGPDSVLLNDGGTAGLPSWQTLTVPFGLTLGQKGKFNGSLTFGGGVPSYDSNRVLSMPWYTLPGSENGTFLQNGTVDLFQKVTIQKYQHSGTSSSNTAEGGPQEFSARLNFNSDSITFPNGADFCQANFSIILNVTTASTNMPATLEVPVPAFPLSSSEKPRCTTASVGDSALELGLPFFSLTYVMVPSLNSSLYITLPNDYNLEPSPAVFSPSATLVAPPAPPPTAAATTSSAAAAPVLRGSKLMSALCSVLLAALL